MGTERYVYDTLYGQVHFPDYVWTVLTSPELQRLREVRLCNINSLCLPGGANINRYEHSLGTAHLAQVCLDAWWWPGLTKQTQRHVVLAALLHDIGTTAFGHSVQYVLAPAGYEHEALYEQIGARSNSGSGYTYRQTLLQPVFFGLQARLPVILGDDELRAVSDLVEGRGSLGPLINGTIDLDNIDNVFRLAYHIGLTGNRAAPEALAGQMRIEDDAPVFTDAAVSNVEEWYDVRRRLYKHLLLNPEEFSAKCMLQEAIEQAYEQSPLAISWSDTDYELVMKLARCKDSTASITTRLMTGELYGCLGIFSTTNTSFYEVLNSPRERHELEERLVELLRAGGRGPVQHATVAIHGILDVNKTQREVQFRTDSGRMVCIGVPSRRLLIGVFLRNVHLRMGDINRELQVSLSNLVLPTLATAVRDADLQEIPLYSEATDG